MKTATLPNDSEALKAIIVEQDAAIQEQKERYESKIEFLEERLRFLQREIFGRKTEKRPQPDDPQQLRLFDEAEKLVREEKPEPEAVVVPEHTRQKPKRKPLPEYFPRIEVVHDLEEEEKVCGCGATLSRIGEEVCEKLDVIPAQVRVIRHIRYKYACKCCQGVESEGPAVKIAPPPPQLIPKGMATGGLVAYIATAKYVDALPLYRQEKIFARHGIDISRSTMAGWMVMAADRCGVLMGSFARSFYRGRSSMPMKPRFRFSMNRDGRTRPSPTCGSSEEGGRERRLCFTAIPRPGPETYPGRSSMDTAVICRRMPSQPMSSSMRGARILSLWVVLLMLAEIL